MVQRDESGKETGIGFVEFLTEEDAEKALERDRKSMGHRYVEFLIKAHSKSMYLY